ncbi:MAG: TetR family transcriptional regulator [Anaerolineales bacterium]|jgi:TetR/AcrR family acrAB operon transcriptional repressor
MRRTKEEAEVTKQNLLAAGLEVFSRKGYKATRVEDIVRQANVTTGALYHHFGGKSELYTTLIEKSSARANQLVQQIVEEGGTPANVLRRLLVRSFEFGEEDEEYRAVIELSLKETANSPELSKISKQILESRRMLAQFFENLIREGIAVGEFNPDTSPEDAALTLVGFMNGMGFIWVQDPDFFSIKDRAESLVETFLLGILFEGR